MNFIFEKGKKEPYTLRHTTEPSKEYDRLVNAFDSFMTGFNKDTKKSKHKKHTPKKTLKKFESDLRRDVDLTPEEKFELYYEEHKSLKKQEEAKSLRQSLKKAGLKKPPGNSQTPKK